MPATTEQIDAFVAVLEALYDEFLPESTTRHSQSKRNRILRHKERAITSARAGPSALWYVRIWACPEIPVDRITTAAMLIFDAEDLT